MTQHAETNLLLCEPKVILFCIPLHESHKSARNKPHSSQLSPWEVLICCQPMSCWAFQQTHSHIIVTCKALSSILL